MVMEEEHMPMRLLKTFLNLISCHICFEAFECFFVSNTKGRMSIVYAAATEELEEEEEATTSTNA